MGFFQNINFLLVAQNKHYSYLTINMLNKLFCIHSLEMNYFSPQSLFLGVFVNNFMELFNKCFFRIHE